MLPLSFFITIGGSGRPVRHRRDGDSMRTTETDADIFAGGWRMGAPAGMRLADFEGTDWAAEWFEEEPMPEPEWSQNEAGIRAVFPDGSALLLGHYLNNEGWIADGMFAYLTAEEWSEVEELESFFRVVWAESSEESFPNTRLIGAGGAVGVGTVGECDGCGEFVPFGFLIDRRGVRCAPCARDLV